MINVSSFYNFISTAPFGSLMFLFYSCFYFIFVIMLIENKARCTYRKFQDRKKDSRAMLYLIYNAVNAILGGCMLYIGNK